MGTIIAELFFVNIKYLLLVEEVSSTNDEWKWTLQRLDTKQTRNFFGNMFKNRMKQRKRQSISDNKKLEGGKKTIINRHDHDSLFGELLKSLFKGYDKAPWLY